MNISQSNSKLMILRARLSSNSFCGRYAHLSISNLEPWQKTGEILYFDNDEPLAQKKTIFPIMISIIFSTILYTFLQPFYPLFMQDNFPNLSSVHFSIILATFETCALITCLFLGIYMP